MSVFFKRLRPSAVVPERKTKGAAAFDMCADVQGVLCLRPGDVFKIPTGIAMEMPSGLMGLIRPRSSWAVRGFDTIRPPIDSDYRGEIHIIGVNLGREELLIRAGDRIAQLCLSVVLTPLSMEVDKLTETKRGEGGFGSTGQGSVDPNADTAVMDVSCLHGFVDGMCLQCESRPVPRRG